MTPECGDPATPGTARGGIAIPLTAAVLGHLPSTDAEDAWVKLVGYIIFLLAFSSILGNYYYGESNIEFIT